ncbi:MAG: hypothetical protein JO266_08530 [Acidobacteria bacterium]|nr:hypothetical protein [Acidobacteriota bacterium]
MRKGPRGAWQPSLIETSEGMAPAVGSQQARGYDHLSFENTVAFVPVRRVVLTISYFRSCSSVDDLATNVERYGR